jgi:hypothetical protein
MPASLLANLSPSDPAVDESYFLAFPSEKSQKHVLKTLATAEKIFQNWPQNVGVLQYLWGLSAF